MYFCIRDDDTCYFTSPEQLESAYGDFTRYGPVSLAIVPFCRAGTSKGVPARFRGQWSVHSLHENEALVAYLRAGIAEGRYEAMLHGYHHDEFHGKPEFAYGGDLMRRIDHGRKYLEDILHTKVRVFVPPHNAIGRQGLLAVTHAGLHLGGIGGMRKCWPRLSRKNWRLWFQLRHWQRTGGVGIPWVLDLGDHREIAGNPVTPSSSFQKNRAILDRAIAMNGVFCAATHYWELQVPSIHPGEPAVGDHLRRLIEIARSDSNLVWHSVGEIVAGCGRLF